MIEKTWVVGPFQCNCRLVACPETGRGALIDPGDEPGKLLRELEGARTESGQPIRIEYLLHTHGHLDHVAATRGVREKLGDGAKIAIHRADEPLYKALRMQGELFGLRYDDPLPVDKYLEEGESVGLGTLKLTMIHTPGHSPGSLCMRLHEDSARGARESLFSGDTLFAGSVGRTDLWGADQDAMFRSIRERILTLDDDTRVCPGHGPDTTVGIERRGNPFLK